MKNIIIILLILISTFQLKSQEWTNYDLKDLYSDFRDLYDLDIDSKQNIWFASLSSLVKFDGKEWTVYDTSNSDLPHNELFSVGIDKDDKVWVGYDYGNVNGLAIFDGQSWVNYNNENSNFDTYSIRDIIFDKNNNPWVGTKLFLWTFKNGDWIKILNKKVVNTNYTFVDEIEVDSNNNIWFTTERDGIVRYTNGILNKYSHLDPYSYDGLAVDSNNNIWVFNNDSLMHLEVSTRRWEVIETEITQPSNSASPKHTIIVDRHNNLWISERRNLHHFYPETNVWHTYSAPDSLFDPNGAGYFRDFKIDAYGNFWFITASEGVFKLSGVITNVNELEANNPSINIYPNPATSQLVFEYNNSELITEYSIVNSEGKVQFQHTSRISATHTVDVSRLSVGVYFLQLTNNKGTKLSKKFIVE